MSKKLFQLFLLCVSFAAIGCNSAPPPPSEEKVSELNAKMDADMKTMMKQVPKKPVGIQ